MSWVTYIGVHPEPSLGWPEITGVLRVWPARGASSQNLSLCFPRGVPRKTPVLAALWLAAARRRDGPWFRVRLERGEWQEACARWLASGLPTSRAEPEPRRRPLRTWRRRHRMWARRHAKRVRQGRIGLVAADVLALTSPNHLSGFLAGCRGRYDAANRTGVVVEFDPLKL